jgi:hypothetical protein
MNDVRYRLLAIVIPLALAACTAGDLVGEGPEAPDPDTGPGGVLDSSAATLYGFAPGMSTDCWSYEFIVGKSHWIGGNGTTCDFAHYATPPRYTIQLPAEDMGGKPFPSSGVASYPLPYEGWIPSFFSQERQDNLPPPASQYRQHPNLVNFAFNPRADAPGRFSFDAVLDKVNAVGMSADERGTSIGMFLTENFYLNELTATDGPALALPNLAPNESGHGLQVNVGVQLHDRVLLHSHERARICPGSWSGDQVTGHCDSFATQRIGPASARVLVGVGISANDKVYWLDLVLWREGPNLFDPYNHRRNPNHYLSPEIVLERGPDSSTFEQIYIDVDRLAAGKRLAPGLPPCPALAYGRQHARPGRGDHWFGYGIDVTALVQCIPWTTPITDLSHAVVGQVSVGTVVNGVGRVYWAARDLLTFKP